MGDNIFDIIMDYSVNEGMDKILLENEEYIGIQKEIDEQIAAYKKSGLTKEQLWDQCQDIDNVEEDDLAS